MIKVAIRAQYPELGKYNWYNSIKPFKVIDNIELAFHSPDNFMRFVEPDAVIYPIKDLEIGVPTIHMAHTAIGNFGLFMEVLVKTANIAKELKCKNLIVHPTNARLKDVISKIENVVTPLLNEWDIDILWETFLSKRRFLGAFEPLGEFCREHLRHYICFDIVHMQRHCTEDILLDISRHENYIKSYHFSNWHSKPFKQHLPINEGIYDCNRILDNLIRLKFDGTITLEYLPEYHNQLVEDAQHLLRKIYK